MFIGWLFARWILLVDLDCRFPNVPAKPTVSNPCVWYPFFKIFLFVSYVYVDQNLLQAEKLAQIAMEIRQKTPKAVQFLKQLLENDENSGKFGNVEVPTAECFYPKMDIITKVYSFKN